MPPYTKKTLSNGLRVVLVPLRDTASTMVMILAETGSEYETKKQNGISHFLEHMCFKGTTKRPSSKIINSELDGLGADSNAFTNTDYTGFYAKAHKSKTAKILDIVSDIYLHSTFPEKEIEKEKGVVIEEINMYEDRPQSKVWDVLGNAIFGDQPAGRTIIGTKETVSSISRKDLLSYHKSHYVPEATTVVVSGKIDEEVILKQVTEIFGKIPKSTKAKRTKVKDVQKEAKIAIHKKKSDQTHIVMAFRTGISRYDEKNVYKVGLLASILGQGMSSRLFHTIREELGLAYYIGASHSPGIDYGFFTISIGVSNKNVEKAIAAICNELRIIKQELVGDEEMTRVKERRKGGFYLGLETSNDWADFYGFQELYHDKIETPKEVIAKRDAVTAEEVQDIAQKIFQPEKLTIAMVGPGKGEKEILKQISL